MAWVQSLVREILHAAKKGGSFLLLCFKVSLLPVFLCFSPSVLVGVGVGGQVSPFLSFSPLFLIFLS